MATVSPFKSWDDLFAYLKRYADTYPLIERGQIVMQGHIYPTYSPGPWQEYARDDGRITLTLEVELTKPLPVTKPSTSDAFDAFYFRGHSPDLTTLGFHDDEEEEHKLLGFRKV